MSSGMSSATHRPMKRSSAIKLTGSRRANLQRQVAASSPKLLPQKQLRCYSVACGDLPQLEFGDKIVLPPTMLLELQCLKVPTPLLFQIHAHAQVKGGEEDKLSQYCSVQEFSAPEGTAYVPYWMMQHLLLEEGATVVVSSIADVPRGTYCRLQPESASFLSLAADIGPKVLMESALRRYSVLSVDATILVEYANQRFFLRVAELKPAAVISLCGDVDLETDFMAPEHSDLKRLRSQDEQSQSLRQQQSGDLLRYSGEESQDDAAPTDSSLPMRATTNRRCTDPERPAIDTVYKAPRSNVTGNQSEADPPRQSINGISLQRAQERVRQRQHGASVSTSAVAALAPEQSTAMHLRCAQLAFSSSGHRLDGSIGPHDAVNESTRSAKQSVASTAGLGANASRIVERMAGNAAPAQASECPLCLTQIPDTTRELHAVRCARNPAYHKFECPACHERVLNVEKAHHLHCSHCTAVLSSVAALQKHQDDAHTLSVKCRDCGEAFTRDALSAHCASKDCTHAFEACGICGLAYKRKDMHAHVSSCASRTDKCETCQRFIKVSDMATHACIGPQVGDAKAQNATACTLLPRISDRSRDSASNSSHNTASSARSASLECVYCGSAGFVDAASVARHAATECRIARSFASSPEEQASQRDESGVLAESVCASVSTSTLPRPVAVHELLQGRLRRKDDAARLVRTRFPPIGGSGGGSNSSNNNNSSSNNNQASTNTSTLQIDAVTRRAAMKSAALHLDTMSGGRIRAPTAKKTAEPTRIARREAVEEPLSVRSAACVLSAPGAGARRLPRGRPALP